VVELVVFRFFWHTSWHKKAQRYDKMMDEIEQISTIKTAGDLKNIT
jgi:hypothetical protein